MAEYREANGSFHSKNKSQIDDELLPDLDDSVLQTARIRKNQVSKCILEAQNIVSNSVKYYSHVTVESEPLEYGCSLESLDINKYGPIDFSNAQNLSTFSKELSSCLNEMNDLKESSQPKSDINRKVQQGRFSRIKSSHLIPGSHIIGISSNRGQENKELSH